MNLKKSLLVGLIALGTFTAMNKESYAFGWFGKKDSKKQVLQVKGSDTIVNASQAVAEEYMAQNKGDRIAVTGGGSGTGIAGIINKTVDVAMASRKMKESEWEKAREAGLDLEEVTIGFDGITVVVNQNNPVGGLSKETLGKIFTGEISNWKEVGGRDADIIVLSRDSSSGTHAYFKTDVLRKGDKHGTEEYSANALFLPSNVALKQEIAQNENAIAYIGMGYMDDTVKSLAVDGIQATFENVASKQYPIARGVFWYAAKERDGLAKKLVDFVLSEDGQDIIKKEGFVPVK